MFGVMHWVIPVFVACSTFGAANGAALASGRLLYAAARHGHLPKLLAMIHNTRGVPIPGLILQVCIFVGRLFKDYFTLSNTRQFYLLLNGLNSKVVNIKLQ